MKKQEKVKKLSLKKLQITKINDLSKIYGGTRNGGLENGDGGDGGDCKFPENASKVKDDSLHI
ncbi:MAG: hypothetical protein K0R36_3139 [Chryseobacterium sp.]|jgi:hypothetical protein|uniref:hypothetical protein n=1 Tax=Chryseobacterium sp. TaxID=1871047 RepID=UPI002621F2B4|nr:hypothetical protein [Chryseobacterium sp.]MDF2551628.1 hypothetical protein [Chryseobacterium sp.]MDF2933808.1 hypothetical protein [Chryseobacterium sp.]